MKTIQQPTHLVSKSHSNQLTWLVRLTCPLQEQQLHDRVQHQAQLLQQLQHQHTALNSRLQALEGALGNTECILVGMANLSLSVAPMQSAAVDADSKGSAEGLKDLPNPAQHVSCKPSDSSSSGSCSIAAASRKSSKELCEQLQQEEQQQLQQQRVQVCALDLCWNRRTAKHQLVCWSAYQSTLPALVLCALLAAHVYPAHFYNFSISRSPFFSQHTNIVF
jgi:hypothetical protein